MKRIEQNPVEGLYSKLAFTFAAWGLILPFLGGLAVVLGYMGLRNDRAVHAPIKTSVIAMTMGYLELAGFGLTIYLYSKVTRF